MAPELHEVEYDRQRLEPYRGQPETVGAPSEYAEAEEFPQALGLLAQIAAGIGIALPVVVVVGAVLGMCGVCALVMVAASWGPF